MMTCCFCQSSIKFLVTIHLRYEEFNFSFFNAFNSDLLCVSCATKKHIEDFEKHGRKIITKENDEIKVKWDVYLSGKGEELFIVSNILLSLGILSRDPKGNWSLLEDGSPRMPRYKGEICYFTRREDAVEYHRVFYGELQSFKREIWNINQIHSL